MKMYCREFPFVIQKDQPWNKRMPITYHIPTLPGVRLVKAVPPFDHLSSVCLVTGKDIQDIRVLCGVNKRRNKKQTLEQENEKKE